METETLPAVGDWFKNEQGQSFEVVSIDEEYEAVEIQYFDGSVEELDFETWKESRLIPREPPEDWTGPFDIGDGDVAEDFDESLHPGIWSGPLDSFDRDLEYEWGD